MTLDWEPIDTAPKDGTRILCHKKGWDCPVFLIWKTNSRIVDAHRFGENTELSEEYFGDCVEYDDYDLAELENGPSHWLRLPPFKGEKTHV